MQPLVLCVTECKASVPLIFVFLTTGFELSEARCLGGAIHPRFNPKADELPARLQCYAAMADVAHSFTRYVIAKHYIMIEFMPLNQEIFRFYDPFHGHYRPK